MKRLIRAVPGASGQREIMRRVAVPVLISACSLTLVAPLMSAGAAAPDFTERSADFCAAGFGYDSNSRRSRAGAGAPMSALAAAKSEVEESDGAIAGTAYMVRNIRFSGGSDPSPIAAVGDTVFFSATGQGGRELWKSDGTEAGTKQVKDIKPGGSSSNPYEFEAVGARLFFSADDGTHGRELFVSDGTSVGTRLVKDIKSAGSSEPSAMVDVNGTLYFSADGQGGRELWKSDGTAAGTRRVKDLRVGPKGSNPGEIIAVGPNIYFSAFNKATGARQVWRSDGSAAGTYPLTGSEFYRSPRTLTRVGNLVYFLGDSSGCAPSTYLLRTDGTNEGTLVVTYANGEENYGDGLLATSFKSRLFLVEYGDLEKVNQAGTGLVTVKSFDDPVAGNEATILDMRRIGSTLYLMVDIVHDEDGSYQAVDRQLWASDGTSSGTTMVASFGPMYVGPMLTELNGELFFWSVGSVLRHLAHGRTTVGTTLAAEIHAPYEQYLTAAGDSLYFNHDDGSHGRELWRLPALATRYGGDGGESNQRES